MKCDKCGGIMEKTDDLTLKCKSCGLTKNVEEIVEEKK